MKYLLVVLAAIALLGCDAPPPDAIRVNTVTTVPDSVLPEATVLFHDKDCKISRVYDENNRVSVYIAQSKGGNMPRCNVAVSRN